jgi:DNA-binding MarR family transcriptional regulator
MARTELAEQAAQFENLMPKLNRQLLRLDLEDPTMQLPMGQLRVCSILSDGPRTISSLARELRITVSAATQLADRLESASLVERTPGGKDRRVKALRLTDDGRRLMRVRRHKRVRRAMQMLAQIDPGERQAFLSALEELLQDGAHRSPPRPAR